MVSDVSEWNVKRPKEQTRQIIPSITCAVNEFHSNGSFHGVSYHLENFSIHYDELVIGVDCKVIKRIFLIHENVKLNEFFGVSIKNKF